MLLLIGFVCIGAACYGIAWLDRLRYRVVFELPLGFRGPVVIRKVSAPAMPPRLVQKPWSLLPWPLVHQEGELFVRVSPEGDTEVTNLDPFRFPSAVYAEALGRYAEGGELAPAQVLLGKCPGVCVYRGLIYLPDRMQYFVGTDSEAAEWKHSEEQQAVEAARKRRASQEQ